ncbi:MAG: T9SS type A sorting domain-containing protein [Saprospiraceae bacterium]|nr:T9SS type A sorting domain-containing protein [Saprospiraceae bacterium]
MPYLLPACEHYGQIAVNKTGDRIAIWGDCKIMVWNFDRCSGDITGPKEYPTPAHWFYGGGVAFSNSGRYLYATDQVSLQRIDLEGPLGPLDTMRLSFNPYDPDGEDIRQVPGNSFHYLFLAPDGYIYGTVASRGRYFHLLKENDGAGIADIDFLPKGLPLPGINVRSIPHFPNFKLADMPESLCDTLGINMETNALDEIEIAELKLYPNPAQDQIRLFWQNDMEEQGFYQIFASTGALLLSGNLQGIGADGVDIHTIPPGLYAFQLNHKQGIHVTLFVKE